MVEAIILIGDKENIQLICENNNKAIQNGKHIVIYENAVSKNIIGYAKEFKTDDTGTKLIAVFDILQEYQDRIAKQESMILSSRYVSDENTIKKNLLELVNNYLVARIPEDLLIYFYARCQMKGVVNKSILEE